MFGNEVRPQQLSARTLRRCHTMDDFNAQSGLTVVIPRPVWKVATSFAVLLALTAVAAWLLWCSLDRARFEGSLAGAVDIAIDAAMLAAVAIVGFSTPTSIARHPEFAVGKDGIRLPGARRSLGPSCWSRGDIGLCLWVEIVFWLGQPFAADAVHTRGPVESPKRTTDH